MRRNQLPRWNTCQATMKWKGQPACSDAASRAWQSAWAEWFGPISTPQPRSTAPRTFSRPRTSTSSRRCCLRWAWRWKIRQKRIQRGLSFGDHQRGGVRKGIRFIAVTPLPSNQGGPGGVSRVGQRRTECYCVAQSGTEWHSVAQSGTEWHSVGQSGTEWHSVLQTRSKPGTISSGDRNARMQRPGAWKPRPKLDMTDRTPG